MYMNIAQQRQPWSKPRSFPHQVTLNSWSDSENIVETAGGLVSPCLKIVEVYESHNYKKHTNKLHHICKMSHSKTMLHFIRVNIAT